MKPIFSVKYMFYFDKINLQVAQNRQRKMKETTSPTNNKKTLNAKKGMN